MQPAQKQAAPQGKKTQTNKFGTQTGNLYQRLQPETKRIGSQVRNGAIDNWNDH